MFKMLLLNILVYELNVSLAVAEGILLNVPISSASVASLTIGVIASTDLSANDKPLPNFVNQFLLAASSTPSLAADFNPNLLSALAPVAPKLAIPLPPVRPVISTSAANSVPIAAIVPYVKPTLPKNSEKNFLLNIPSSSSSGTNT